MILIVKPAFFLSRHMRLAVLMLAALALLGCGQRGPLYLPSKPDAAPSAVPAPASADSKTPVSK